MGNERSAGSQKASPEMRRCSPDSTSGRSPDSPNRDVHLTARAGNRDPRRHRFDAVVAAFVGACRAAVPSERTIEFYLEGLNSYRAFAGEAERVLTLADLDWTEPAPGWLAPARRRSGSVLWKPILLGRVKPVTRLRFGVVRL